jgi:hypothetical protein
VVDRRHKGEANLAHDLEPKLERGASIAPLSLGKCRPDVCGGRRCLGCVGESRVHRHLVETSYPIDTVSDPETWTLGDFTGAICSEVFKASCAYFQNVSDGQGARSLA